MKVHEFMHEMRTTSAILGRTSGVSVVFEGEEAKTDGKTIWLPALPQQLDLTREQVLAMRGYVDHEAGHNRHSDMKRIMSFYDRNKNNGREDLNGLHNSLEDVFMEEKVLDEYPGSVKNLRQTTELVRRKEYGWAKELPDGHLEAYLKDNPNEAAGMAIVTSEKHNRGVKHGELMREYLPDEWKTMGDHWADLASECRDSSEVIELAKKIYQYTEQTDTEDMSPEDFDSKSESGELSDLEGEENEGSNSSGYKEDSEGAEEAARKGKAEKGEGEGKANKPSQDIGETLNSGEDAAGGIGSCVDNGLRGGYRVASTVNDHYYKRGAPMPAGGNSKCHTIVNDTESYHKYDAVKSHLRADVMTMKNKLRRSLMARQQRDWDFGRESGRLDSKRLVAASQRSPTVYKRRTDREELDTAISILIDLSGSMSGPRIETARDCAIALSECFEGTGMSYRIAGFSNRGGFVNTGSRSGKYHRYEQLDHMVFKDFDDPLRITRGSVYQIGFAAGGNNSDYDFVDRELFDLSRRKEPRRVLFVLSDGQVACVSDAPSYEHNRLIKENLRHYKNRYGVESVGIGIQSDAVSDIYPDYVVVNDVSELSGAAFGMLTKILLDGKVA